ncbi:MAG: hypothetical protein KBG76_17850, partial [Saprospiraceae bacterium]|nr:hypothetical protein [Saprospiraceae bacterium]
NCQIHSPKVCIQNGTQESRDPRWTATGYVGPFLLNEHSFSKAVRSPPDFYCQRKAFKSN